MPTKKVKEVMPGDRVKMVMKCVQTRMTEFGCECTWEAPGGGRFITTYALEGDPAITDFLDPTHTSPPITPELLPPTAPAVPPVNRRS